MTKPFLWHTVEMLRLATVFPPYIIGTNCAIVISMAHLNSVRWIFSKGFTRSRLRASH